MQKAIRRPKNWQDFETLCKKLWSEVFKSNDFKKNGRNGQSQVGVDIYGIPKGEGGYFGIQCKLKTDNGKLKKSEIEQEIAFAEQFSPILRHLIVASTASKDVKIEEFIRSENLERIRQGKFGVQLYLWEDIEDLLGENYQTYQWYLRNLDVQKQYSVGVSFSDERNEITIRPRFLRNIKRYVYVPSFKNLPLELSEAQKRMLAMQEGLQMEMYALANMIPVFGGKYKVNYAWCDLEILFKNCGGGALHHWELRFYIDPQSGCFSDPEERGAFLIPQQKPKKIEWEHQVLYHSPDHHPFVQNDSRSIELSVKPNPGVEEISIIWELIAEDFNDSGELVLIVEPEILVKEEVIEVDSEDKEGSEDTLRDFCDYPADEN